MRVASAWYFAVKDTASYLKRNKRAVLFALLFVLVGLTVGVLISLNVEDTEFSSYINEIMLNVYRPFVAFLKIAFFSAICTVLCYMYMAGGFARVMPYIILFYCGLLIGRSAMLNMILCKAVGFFSFFIFVLPCYFALVAAILVFLNHMRERASCGLSGLFLRQNLNVLKRGLLYAAFAMAVQFLVFVLLGGIMSLILKV